MNIRQIALIKLCIIASILLFLIIFGLSIDDELVNVNFKQKNLSPSLTHFFGTDWLGRDVFYRTLRGISNSLLIGISAACISSIISFIIGCSAGLFPKWIDEICSFLIDLFISVPHLILLLLISFALGGGVFGVTIGIIFSHWTSLARVMRAEVLQLREEQYIKQAAKLGNSRLKIALKHIFPSIIPQFIIGIILLFPHAILHESAISFLGFGLSPEGASIGIMLSESLRYISSNMWWLFLPGISLVIIVILFDFLGENCKKILSSEQIWR